MKQNIFANKYLGEFVEPPLKVRQRPCGCLEELSNKTRIWKMVSHCTLHLKAINNK